MFTKKIQETVHSTRAPSTCEPREVGNRKAKTKAGYILKRSASVKTSNDETAQRLIWLQKGAKGKSLRRALKRAVPRLAVPQKLREGGNL